MKSKHFSRILSETPDETRKMVKNYLDDLDKNVKKECQHPEHNFPTHLYIPAGETHTHVCPNCGNEITVTTPIVIL